jgi:hypothetical protein
VAKPKRERNPIYVERPQPRAARKVWDALVAAGYKKINLWFEDIGNALEMCGPVGGWQFQDESGAGEWLGYDSDTAAERAREMGARSTKPQPGPELMYRYEDVTYAAPFDETGTLPGTLVVELRTYQVVRRTDKGCWVALCSNDTPGGDDQFLGMERFVLTGAHKRFACPTIEEARLSFIARKRRQASIYRAKMERALWAISQAVDVWEPIGPAADEPAKE